MSRSMALVVAVVLLAAVGAVSAVLVIQFRGNDTAILMAAILGFLTPTIASLLTLLQASMNAEKTAAVGAQVAQTSAQVAQTSAQVAQVDKKVNGHLSRLTQIVVDSATHAQPVSVVDAALLAAHTESLTGIPISRTTAAEATADANDATQAAAAQTERAANITAEDAKGKDW
jgi:hypothetical protein